MNPVPQEDLDCIERQLGRTPRDVHGIAYRCPCGKPAVVETNPRLADGTPFPTFYYATCPKLTGAISTLETTGMMGDMNARLAINPELSGAYSAAHEDYLAARAALKVDVPEIENANPFPPAPPFPVAGAGIPFAPALPAPPPPPAP